MPIIEFDAGLGGFYGFYAEDHGRIGTTPSDVRCNLTRQRQMNMLAITWPYAASGNSLNLGGDRSVIEEFRRFCRFQTEVDGKAMTVSCPYSSVRQFEASFFRTFHDVR